MKLLHFFCVFLTVLASTWAEDVATVLGPRGARPVEHGYKADKCATEKNWPFCSDDDWGPKCPSGCRIQGLLDKADHSLLKKIEKIRQLLDQNRAKHRSADQASKQTYDYLKEKLTSNAGNDNSFYDLAEHLRHRIIDIKIKIERQLRILNALKTSIKDQVIEMQRLEVDIDIKLRSCKGSCKGYAEFSVDQASYVALDKQMDQLESQSVPSVETVSTLYVMKSRPLKDVVVDSKYKSGPAEEQKEVFFPEVKTVKLTLETQGSSSSSAATASQVPVCSLWIQQGNGVSQSVRQRDRGRRGRCPDRPEHPLCSDHQWESRCPSGCRLQGLMEQTERQTRGRLRDICERRQRYEDAATVSMVTTKHIYYINRKAIVKTHMSELRYVEFAEGLAMNLTSLRKRSAALLRKLKEQRSHVQKQLEDMYRQEVDVEIKLRSCQGSCNRSIAFHIDHNSYRSLANQMTLFSNTAKHRKSSLLNKDIAKIKLQPVAVGPPPSTDYKTIPMVQKELLTQFEDLEQNHVVLEEVLEETECLGSERERGKGEAGVLECK
ncbi:uncharacterized protein LOC110536442 isoform X2 [Oncorhynchus mykiss]|uniref:Fibrinogen alpha/beta/gamma chain coiled coil domain-containing protein n=1 Tax=Oncorhynchus mykiss TaxID=8022 RepID=A0A8K9VEW9_ONCMY|nr:fibrinogen alpha chain isoform X2 [Oncorhynchus mykiss]XP_036830348.1 uncharacterized protein LOC110536442 isoform X2 [Oncorhynchus mykiss]